MLADVINEVKAILQTVADVGMVNDYRRAVSSEADVSRLYKDVDAGEIRAWDITRETTVSNDRTVGAVEDLHLIVIRGYMSVRDADATEKTFQNLIECVRAAFRVKRNLNGKVLDSTPMQVRTVTAATVSNVLVHYCELTLQAQDFPLSTT
jgi:hypothetical protein